MHKRIKIRTKTSHTQTTNPGPAPPQHSNRTHTLTRPNFKLFITQLSKRLCNKLAPNPNTRLARHYPQFSHGFEVNALVEEEDSERV